MLTVVCAYGTWDVRLFGSSKDSSSQPGRNGLSSVGPVRDTSTRIDHSGCGTQVSQSLWTGHSGRVHAAWLCPLLSFGSTLRPDKKGLDIGIRE